MDVELTAQVMTQQFELTFDCPVRQMVTQVGVGVGEGLCVRACVLAYVGV